MEITFLHWITAFLAYFVSILVHVDMARKATKNKGDNWKFDYRYYFEQNVVHLMVSVLSIILLFIIVDFKIASWFSHFKII